MTQSLEYKKRIESEMHEAMENGDFLVYLQPKINMITSKVYGAEALSRWRHPIEGLRSPLAYVPIFEENGFVVKLDMFMYEEVCKLKARWKEEGVEFADIPISINMSRLHLLREDFVDELLRIARKYNIETKELDIEITETLYLGDHSVMLGVIDELQRHGFLVSIDDFGAGYSALSMLKDISVSTIKIDKDFLTSSGNDERGKKVIKNIIRLCKDLKFKVMVEGVETKEQADYLVNYGCEIAQGYYYSKPIAIDEFEEYARTHYMVAMDVVKFSFNDNLLSDDGRYEAEYLGYKCQYVRGISPSIKAVRFFGGEHKTNCLSLPIDIIHNDSYTISMWLRVDKLITWSAAIFAEYENGFFQFCPLSDDNESCFRIRDRRVLDGWFDSVSKPLEEDCWYHIVVMYDRMAGRGMLYINGELAGSCEDVEALYFLKRILVGGDIYKRSFEGDICEVIFYDRNISEEDIKKLHKQYLEMPDFDAFDE